MGFFEGFEKKAWDLDKARRAGAAIRDRVIHRNMNLRLSRKFEPVPTLTKERGLGPSAMGNAPKHMLADMPEHLKDHPLIQKGKGKIFARGQSGDIIKDHAEGVRMGNTALSGQERELLNRTALQHEATELKYAPKVKKDSPFAKGYGKGHVHPGVLLEESNMVATMPHEMGRVKNIFTKARKGTGEAAAMSDAVPGFTYGETRLSRHGRKRMAEILERKAKNPPPPLQKEVVKMPSRKTRPGPLTAPSSGSTSRPIAKKVSIFDKKRPFRPESIGD